MGSQNEHNNTVKTEKPAVDFERETKIDGTIVNKRQFIGKLPDQMQDAFEVQGGNPEYIYNWINRKEERVSMKKYEGYEIVTESMAKADKLHYTSPDGKSVDAVLSIGDLVLGRVRKSIYDAKKQKARNRANMLNQQSKAEFQNKTGQYGFIADE